MSGSDPAFPQKDDIPHDNDWTTGLTKRELFAAMAMQGLDIASLAPQKVAEWCVEYADALLAELEKKSNG